MKTYVKLDDDLPGNAKVRQVSAEARWVYVASICYAGHNLTDGFIPDGALTLIDGSRRIATALVSAGLWEKASGGWKVHDYERHNRTKDVALRRREVNAANGAIGLANRYGKPLQIASESLSELHGEQLAKRQAKRALSSATADQDLRAAENSASESPSELLDLTIRRICDSWLGEMGGTLPPGPAERLAAVADRTNVDWVCDAIREAAGNNARNPNYVLRILERWERDGRAPKRESESPKPRELSPVFNVPAAEDPNVVAMAQRRREKRGAP